MERSPSMLVWLSFCFIIAWISMFSCAAPCESTYHTQKSLHRHQNKCEIFFAVQAVRSEQRREMKSRQKQPKRKQQQVSFLRLTRHYSLLKEDNRSQSNCWSQRPLLSLSFLNHRRHLPQLSDLLVVWNEERVNHVDSTINLRLLHYPSYHFLPHPMLPNVLFYMSVISFGAK